MEIKIFLILVFLGCSFAGDLIKKTITLKGSTDVKLECEAGADFKSVEWKFTGIETGAKAKTCKVDKGHTEEACPNIPGTKIKTTTVQEDLQISNVNVTHAGTYTCTVTPAPAPPLANPVTKPSGDLAVIENKITCAPSLKPYSYNTFKCSLRVHMKDDPTFTPSITCTHKANKKDIANACDGQTTIKVGGTFTRTFCLILMNEEVIDLECDADLGTDWKKKPTALAVKNKQDVKVEKYVANLVCIHDKKVTANVQANVTCRFQLSMPTTDRPTSAVWDVKIGATKLTNKCGSSDIPAADDQSEVSEFKYHYCYLPDKIDDIKISLTVTMAGVIFNPPIYEGTINAGSTLMLFGPLLTLALTWTVMNIVKY